METIEQALAFEQNSKRLPSRDDKIKAGKRAKELILKLNEMYKKTQDQQLMDLMKRLTMIKRKAEARLYTKVTI